MAPGIKNKKKNFTIKDHMLESRNKIQLSVEYTRQIWNNDKKVGQKNEIANANLNWKTEIIVSGSDKVEFTDKSTR